VYLTDHAGAAGPQPIVARPAGLAGGPGGLPRPDRARVEREEPRHRGCADPRAGRRGADPRSHHIRQGGWSARRGALRPTCGRGAAIAGCASQQTSRGF